MGIFSNRFMVIASGISFLLLLGPLYFPGLQGLFEVQSPQLADWLYVLPLMLVPFTAAEVTKAVLRRLDANSRKDPSRKSVVAAGGVEGPGVGPPGPY